MASMENQHFLNGKTPFSIAMFNYQMVIVDNSHPHITVHAGELSPKHQQTSINLYQLISQYVFVDEIDVITPET